MEPISISPIALSKSGFREFGDVLETDGREHFLINNDMCKRYDRLSEITSDTGVGAPHISIFRGKPYGLPLRLQLLERHPFGSQAFMPLHSDPFLVIVADDVNGEPSIPKVFFTTGHQGVNLNKNTWHGVLTPVIAECEFLVIDRFGPTLNLDEFVLTQNIIITSIPNTPSITPQ